MSNYKWFIEYALILPGAKRSGLINVANFWITTETEINPDPEKEEDEDLIYILHLSDGWSYPTYDGLLIKKLYYAFYNAAINGDNFIDTDYENEGIGWITRI